MTTEQKEEIADLMIRTLVERLGDEVELVFRYGSMIRGGTHRWSDLDMSYVPRTASVHQSITVMVDDILFDLYPMHWATLERLAERDDRSSSILGYSRVVYEGSAEATTRFRSLAERYRSLGAPEARREMVGRALATFQRIGYEYYQLSRIAGRGDLEAAHVHANRIVQVVFVALAQLNQADVDTRRLEQVLAMSRVPSGLDELLARLTAAKTASELLSVCDELLDATRSLLLAVQLETQREEKSAARVLDSLYPELKAGLQRVQVVSERRDRLGAETTLTTLLHDVHLFLARASDGIEFTQFNSLDEYRRDLAGMGFPDLMSLAVAGRFDELAAACEEFDRLLHRRLVELGAETSRYANRDELARALAAGEV